MDSVETAVADDDDDDTAFAPTSLYSKVLGEALFSCLFNVNAARSSAARAAASFSAAITASTASDEDDDDDDDVSMAAAAAAIACCCCLSIDGAGPGRIRRLAAAVILRCVLSLR